MQRILLKSKIHRAVVTDAQLHYQGSITLDRALMDAADLLPHERVEIYNVTNGERFQTYVIPGDRDSGSVVINGAAARKVHPGDLIIIASYALYGADELTDHHPRVVQVDSANRPQRQPQLGGADPTA
jgi:aspartate 1-decarboxylase